jgi:adenylosuccinate synthase
MTRGSDRPTKCRPTAVVLTGALCSGKTTLAENLAQSSGARVVSARDELRRRGASPDRVDLQQFGAELEAATAGAWLADAVLAALERDSHVVVDSARTSRQVAALRHATRIVVVVFLEASLEERKLRFEHRVDPVDRGRSFSAVIAGENEDLALLSALADLKVETDHRSPAMVAAHVDERSRESVAHACDRS